MDKLVGLSVGVTSEDQLATVLQILQKVQRDFSKGNIYTNLHISPELEEVEH